MHPFHGPLPAGTGRTLAVSEPAPTSDPRPRADLEAAAWLVRHDRGLSAEEQDEFLQWLTDDPANGQWLARHRQMWADFNLLAHWRPEHSAAPNPDLLARLHCGGPLSGRHGRQIKRRHMWALAGVALLVFASGLWLRKSEKPSSQIASAPVVARGYEQRRLEDGSLVDLNDGARLEVQFSADERRVHLLSGEVQFTVVKNPSRPFVVRAGGIDVRAVGTSFNVRLAPDTVEILVTEGRVAVDRPPIEVADPGSFPGVLDTGRRPLPDAPLAALTAGQLTVVSLAADAPAPRVVAATAKDMSRLLEWQPQLLEFDSTPLREVLAEFNRRNRIQMVLGDEELGAIPIVASFRSDNLDGFVRLLAITARLRAERRGSDEIVLRRPIAPPP